MKLRLIAVAVATLALTGNAFAQDITSEKGKISYYLGYQQGSALAELTGRGEQLDMNSVIKGMEDAYSKKQPGVTVEQLRPAIEAFQNANKPAHSKRRPNTIKQLLKTRSRVNNSWPKIRAPQV